MSESKTPRTDAACKEAAKFGDIAVMYGYLQGTCEALESDLAAALESLANVRRNRDALAVGEAIALEEKQRMREERDALAARVEQAEADARRWRFVRGKVSRILNERTLKMDGLRVEVYYDEPQAFLIVPTDNGALFDEAIDAALAREEKTK